MTDDEIRRIGQGFIDDRKRIWTANAMQLDPSTIAHGIIRWDYIDPFRMGLYVLTKAGKDPTAWVVDFDHIAHLCTNPSAFKKEPPADSARVGDMNTAEAPIPLPFLSVEREIEALARGEIIELDGKPREPSDAAKRSLADGTLLDAFKAPELLTKH